MKVIGNYLADLAIDLKITLEDELSSTELTRCVERAVADLTRFRPLEKSAEFIIDAEIAAESFTTPAASEDDFYVSAEDLNGIVDGATCTMDDYTPDVPRPVMLTLTHTAITDLVVIVKGRDVDGNYIEEYFYMAGLIANGLIQTGVVYFATVTEVEIDYIVGDGASDVLDVGTGSNFGVYVQLANKPIQFDSDTISSYTRNTHYTMDYYNGRVAMKDATSGDMVVATAYNIKYTKNRVSLDISSLSDLVRIERVEYPVGSTPQSLSTKEVWGSILTLTSSGVHSQAEATDAQHVLVHYLAAHRVPGVSVPGTFPSFLETTVELAASAYALFILAFKYELAAAGLLNTAATGVLGALTNATKYLSNNTNIDAVGILARITTDKAFLREAIHKAGTPNTGALFEANALLLEVSSIDLDVATVGAVAWLLEGELKIDMLTDGKDVPAHFADYARVKTQIGQTRAAAAMGLVQEVAQRLSNLRSYIEQAGAYNRIAEDFLAQAAQYLATATSNMSLADRFRVEAIEKRNEAWAIWAAPPQYAPQYSLGQRGQAAE